MRSPGMPQAPENARWYAFRTRARAEAKVESRLVERGFAAWAARAEIERAWSDRVKRVLEPLFPGYLFVAIEADGPDGTPGQGLIEALSTPGVAGVVRSGGKAAEIRPEEMESVRLLVQGVTETGERPEPVEDPLEPGDVVTIAAGPFRGLRGVVREDRGETRVVIRIDTLRLARSVRLDRSMLEREAG
jgi:transcriptional antiterminator RfaH